jgi:hypothetical protein
MVRTSISKYLFFALLAVICSLAPACRTQSGCPSNADMAPKTNKRGQIVAKKSKASQGLFPKKASKKLGLKG